MISTILVVEDDKDLSSYLDSVLREKNYSVKVANKGSEAIAMVQKNQPDLVLLDLGLPDMDGQSLCQQIKSEFPDIPVIMLTARDSVGDKVRGFEGGADDYLTKPFEPQELFARIKARLKNSDADQTLTVEDLTLDPKKVEVKRGDKVITLTPQEFKLLEYLMTNQGVVLRRDSILNRIWLYSPDVDTRVVDVYIGYLRKKIDSGYKKKLIQSIRGFGYTIKG